MKISELSSNPNTDRKEIMISDAQCSLFVHFFKISNWETESLQLSLVIGHRWIAFENISHKPRFLYFLECWEYLLIIFVCLLRWKSFNKTGNNSCYTSQNWIFVLDENFDLKHVLVLGFWWNIWIPLKISNVLYVSDFSDIERYESSCYKWSIDLINSTSGNFYVCWTYAF